MRLPAILFLALAPLAVSAVHAAETAADAAARIKLPDLRPLPTGVNNRRITVEGGRRLLRFDTYIENIGKGPLEVRGRRNKRTKVMEAFQALYKGRFNRRFRLNKIGEYEWHAVHNHWHLLEVAQYRLLDGKGTEVGIGNKVSFCLVDTVRTSPRLKNSPGTRRYTKCNNDENAKHFKNGISIGWSDVYTANIYGQWIDITGVEPGNYNLEIELNPSHVIQEATLENNTITVPITIPPADNR